MACGGFIQRGDSEFFSRFVVKKFVMEGSNSPMKKLLQMEI